MIYEDDRADYELMQRIRRIEKLSLSEREIYFSFCTENSKNDIDGNMRLWKLGEIERRSALLRVAEKEKKERIKTSSILSKAEIEKNAIRKLKRVEGNNIKKKLISDGFKVGNKGRDGYSAIKNGLVINIPTLRDLFEEIYGSRVYDENLKSTY